MSSEATQAIVKVPTLQGHDDYRVWAVKVKAAARLAAVWVTINGGDKPTDPANAESVFDHRKREDKAIGLITANVSTHLQTELDDLKVPDSTTTSATKEPNTNDISLGARGGVLVQNIASSLQGNGQCTWQKPTQNITNTF
jgi:hypothetical protein